MNPLDPFKAENVVRHRLEGNRETPGARAKSISALMQSVDHSNKASFKRSQLGENNFPIVIPEPPLHLIGSVNDRTTLVEAKQNFLGVNFHALGPSQEPLFSYFSIFSMETGEAIQHYELPLCTPHSLIQAADGGFYMFDAEGMLYHLDPHEDHFSIVYTCLPRTSITCALHSRYDNEVYGTLHFDTGMGGESIFNWNPKEGMRTLMTYDKSTNSRPTLFEASDGNLCGITSMGNRHPYGSFFQIDENKQIQEVFFFPHTLPGEKQLIEGIDGEFYGVATDYGDKKSRVFRLTSQGLIKILLEVSGTNLKPFSADGVHFVLIAEKYGQQRELLEINLTTLKTRHFGVDATRGKLHRIARDNKNELYSLTLEPIFNPKDSNPITISTLAPNRLQAINRTAFR